MIGILHVSDVHFGANDPTGEQRLVTDALIQAVKREKLDPDIVVFSGDLAFSGKDPQFSVGEAWLRQLCDAAPKADLFVVPGNHDVDRSKVTLPQLLQVSGSTLGLYEEWLGATPKPEHLAAFFAWFEDAKSRLPLKGAWASQCGFHHTIAGLDLPVHVVGLNSAMFSCGDADEKKLVIDVKTVNAAFAAAQKSEGLSICVAHHPLHHLADWNEEVVGKFLQQASGADLYLHGHLHAQLGTAVSDIAGRSLTTLAAGASYQGSIWPQQFAFYAIDPEPGELHSNVYTYSSDSGEWVNDKRLSYKIRLGLSLTEKYGRHIASNKVLKGNATERSTSGDASRSIVQQLTASTESALRQDSAVLERGIVRDFEVVIDLSVLRHRNAARVVEARVADYLQNNQAISKLCYAVKHRVKAAERIKEKMNSRGTHDAGEIADICGIRIITFYQSDIPIVLENLLQTIEKDLQPFTRGSSVEIDINTSRTLIDPLSINGRVAEVAGRSSLKPVVKIKPRQTGYSSVHAIVSAPANGGDSELSEIRLEIQIRSVWEDVWSELDHRLRYGSERGGLGASSAQHLNVFKALIDGVVQYVDVIRRESEGDHLKSPNSIKTLKTLASPSEQLELLKGLPPDVYARTSDAFDLWKQADASRQRGGDPGLLRQAADAFESLVREAESLGEGELRDELVYISQGERAYLLTYTGDEFDLAEAAGLYRRILKHRPRDAMALLRLGTVCARQKRFGESDEFLTKAIDVMESRTDARLDDTHWAYDVARLSLALTKWRKFLQTRDQGFLSSAIHLARPVVERPADPSNRLRAVNDLLYYACEERKIEAEGVVYLISQAELADLTEVLERELRASDRGYEYHDTLMAAFVRLKRPEEAVQEACKVRDTLEKIVKLRESDAHLGRKGTYAWTVAISRLLDADQQDSLADAQDVISTFGNSKVFGAKDEP